MVNLACAVCETLLRLEMLANLLYFLKCYSNIVDVKIEVKIIEYSKSMGKFA
jgi:hypothetical protein